eukprot:COSAG01_NODE_745_length_13872_cov_40.816525_2_plen_103_part_00
MAALASVEPVCCIDVTSQHGSAAAGLCAATSASAAEPLPLTAPRIYLGGSGATAAYGTCSFMRAVLIQTTTDSNHYYMEAPSNRTICQTRIYDNIYLYHQMN